MDEKYHRVGSGAVGVVVAHWRDRGVEWVLWQSDGSAAVVLDAAEIEQAPTQSEPQP